MSTIQRIAISAATALLLCASQSHAVSELPFDETVLNCDGGCVFESGADGSLSISALGDSIEITGDLAFDGELRISSRNLAISGGTISADSVMISANESVELTNGASIFTSVNTTIVAGTLRIDGSRFVATLVDVELSGFVLESDDPLRGAARSLDIRSGSITTIAGGLVQVGLASIARPGLVITAIEPSALSPVDAATLDTGGPTLSLAILPEPTTAVLLGAGLALLALARRR